MPVFDTTSPGVGDRLKPRICASRESHPSEDLSELPPLLEAVAGQEYLALTRSLRNSLSCCFVDGWVPLAALMASFMRINRTGGSWRILQSRFALVGRFVRERISVAGYDRAGPVFVKVRKGELCISAPGYSELGENAVHDHQIIAGERSSQFEQKVLLLPG